MLDIQDQKDLIVKFQFPMNLLILMEEEYYVLEHVLKEKNINLKC